MRLIGADALKEKAWDADTRCGYVQVVDIGDIDDAPTIEERKKGEWIEFNNSNHSYICSICGRMLVGITDGKNRVTKKYPFCHCGARMEEGENE